MITIGALAGGQAQNDTTQATQIVRAPITLSGNYGSSSPTDTHGDTLSFSGVFGIQSNSIPIRVFVYQQPASGTAPGNCTGVYCPGTTANNGVISFANAGTELTRGSAYAGAAASAVWVIEAVFPTL
jgi:hypothetical protein